MYSSFQKRVEVIECDNGFILEMHDPAEERRETLSMPRPVTKKSGYEIHKDVKSVVDRLKDFF